MPTTLRIDEHVAAIAAATDVLTRAAKLAGLDAPVPTCPAWDVRALVTHLGMVHRWAAANVRGESGHSTDDSVAEAEGAADLLAWFTDGADSLRVAISDVPDDAAAGAFLNDAPAGRRFWARRQAHETTIHSLDAIGAAAGRVPQASELDIEHDVAVDGIDELLHGFITREKARLRSEEPYTIAVTPDDDERAWTVAVGDGPVVTSLGRPDAADATLRGTAVQLYAGLWNRGDEIASTGRADVLDSWRRLVQIRWGA